MSRSRHTETQIIWVLKQLEAERKAEDVAREVRVSKRTIYAWKAKYGGMDMSQAQEAKQLRDENTKLRKLVAGPSIRSGTRFLIPHCLETLGIGKGAGCIDLESSRLWQ